MNTVKIPFDTLSIHGILLRSEILKLNDLEGSNASYTT